MFHKTVGNLAPEEDRETRVKRLILAKFAELARLHAELDRLGAFDEFGDEPTRNMENNK